MTSFNHFLREKNVSPDIRSLWYHLARAVKYINFSIRANNVGARDSENASGETQQALDVLSDQIIATELEQSELVSLIASEEKEDSQTFSASRGNFFVAYDPLDGSSLIDANFAIGSIFGIWENSEVLEGKKVGTGLVASGYALYGPRIVLVIAIQGQGVHEFELNEVGEFRLTRESVRIEKVSKYFAPGNLRACGENPSYKALVDQWIAEKKTLRYSGGMVPDLHHILTKGNGIFTYPRDKAHPEGKLRLLFEGAPFAFLFSEAGGGWGRIRKAYPFWKPWFRGYIRQRRFSWVRKRRWTKPLRC